MEDIFDQVRQAVQHAKSMKQAVKDQGDVMLDLLDGNLRGLSTYKLAKLKRQLRDLNIHTQRWKE